MQQPKLSLATRVASLGDGDPDAFGVPTAYRCCIRWLLREYAWHLGTSQNTEKHTLAALDARDRGQPPTSRNGHPPASFGVSGVGAAARPVVCCEHPDGPAGALPWQGQLVDSNLMIELNGHFRIGRPQKTSRWITPAGWEQLQHGHHDQRLSIKELLEQDQARPPAERVLPAVSNARELRRVIAAAERRRGTRRAGGAPPPWWEGIQRRGSVPGSAVTVEPGTYLTDRLATAWGIGLLLTDGSLVSEAEGSRRLRIGLALYDGYGVKAWRAAVGHPDSPPVRQAAAGRREVVLARLAAHGVDLLADGQVHIVTRDGAVPERSTEAAGRFKQLVAHVLEQTYGEPPEVIARSRNDFGSRDTTTWGWMHPVITREFVDARGLGKTGTWDGRIPQWVYDADEPFRRAVLQGLWDGDGSCQWYVSSGVKASTSLKLVNRALVEDAARLLSTLPGQKVKAQAAERRNGSQLWEARVTGVAAVRATLEAIYGELLELPPSQQTVTNGVFSIPRKLQRAQHVARTFQDDWALPPILPADTAPGGCETCKDA